MKSKKSKKLKPKTSSKKPRKVVAFDFRKGGPPLWHCELCDSRFKAWMTDDKSWKLMPKKHLKKVVCLPCFRQCLTQRGHDPKAAKISYQAWKNIKKYWADTKDYPADETKILFVTEDGHSESMWCQAIALEGDNEIVVELRNDSIFREDAQHGDEWLATWDGCTVHGGSGRPLLAAIKPL